MRSKRGLVVWAVALLTALASVTPAFAKPPTGGDLTVTVESDGFMWANSDGDLIEFYVTVTNKTRGTVSDITLTFPGNDPVLIGDLGKRQKWEGGPIIYTVNAAVDFAGLPTATQSEVKVGEAVATGLDDAGNPVTGTTDVLMTAYPVEPCPPGAADGSFTWGPNSEDYTVCALTPGQDLFGYWTFTTTVPKPKKGKGPQSPTVTVRDAVPGNWCNHDPDGKLPQDVSPDGREITDRVFFPADGVCLGGGAGGDTIPVRNSTTFYLATWENNVVKACPGYLDSCPPPA